MPLALSGCALQSAVVHDGLDAHVIDAETNQALPGAFVYDRVDTKVPHALAHSDAAGAIVLEPAYRLTVAFPTLEGIVYEALWVCKDGYTPVLVGARSGWNADYSPAQIYRPGTIELVRSKLDAAASCADIKWGTLPSTPKPQP